MLHKYIFIKMTFDTRWRYAYLYASLPSGLLLRLPLPFRTDVNGRGLVICERLEVGFVVNFSDRTFFLPQLSWAVC